MARCSRCGRETHVEYGSDGQPYCSSCIFYGLNKPCFKCRMYLPASELQQYKGMWMCPYCLMDSRDEDRVIERRSEDHLKEYVTSEKCERCGRTLSIVYYHAGKRLCETCIEDVRREWKDVGGEKPPLPLYRITEKKARESGLLAFLEALFSELLGRLGIKVRKKKEAEIVALKSKKKAFVPFAKPMKEEAMKEEAEIEAVKKKGKKDKKAEKKETEKEKEKKKEKFGSFKKD